MTVVDTSVIVASFASWHELHSIADATIDSKQLAIGHAIIESYSVLTRLPLPHRAPPNLVQEYINDRFPKPYLVLTGNELATFIESLPSLKIHGGSTYDALIAMTAKQFGHQLITCDSRAIPVYDAIGVEYITLS